MVEIYIPFAQNTSSYSLAPVRLVHQIMTEENYLLVEKLFGNKLNVHVSNQVTCGLKPLRTLCYLTLPSGAGCSMKIMQCLYNSRPLAVATRESARLVNVKGSFVHNNKRLFSNNGP